MSKASGLGKEKILYCLLSCLFLPLMFTQRFHNISIWNSDRATYSPLDNSIHLSLSLSLCSLKLTIFTWRIVVYFMKDSD